MRRLVLLVSLLLSFQAFSAHGAPKLSCYRAYKDIQAAKFAWESGRRTGTKPEPVLRTAYGTKVPIVSALEKEGLFYEDIHLWFGELKPRGVDKMKTRITREKTEDIPPHMIRWLRFYPKRYAAPDVAVPSNWKDLSPEVQWEFIFGEGNFKKVNLEGAQLLFEISSINFDDITGTVSTAPKGLTVGDDLGSYEVRSSDGIVDLMEFMDQRDIVETSLESMIGHQHRFHAWPRDARLRARMAPRYIENLDALSWYLFWRQMRRDPEDVESILTHPYLGIYTRSSLLRLHKAVVEGNVARFKNKYRMIGARNFKASPNIPEQGEGQVPDWETRSGNKGPKRDDVEEIVEARLISGDYTGLRDFRSYKFDPSMPIEEMASPFLSAEDVQILKRFEQSHPMLEWSSNGNSHNHFRNKFLSPLMPWHVRINVAHKEKQIRAAQRRFARRLVQTARDYFQRMNSAKNRDTILEIREDATEEMENLVYLFAAKARLDMDFERYVKPIPSELPAITVETGFIDVNKHDLGIEYSFRFPIEFPVASHEDARARIESFAGRVSQALGGTAPERGEGNGHGHSITAKYKFTDSDGLGWRAEWDGIQRDYVRGKAVNARGGHIEMPTPKWSPQDAVRQLKPLFEGARAEGLQPSRRAGGGHVNVDIQPLHDLGPTGPRKALNLVALYENVRLMTTFLWQHPSRQRVALAVELKPDFVLRANRFNGDWHDLAVLLYEGQYFNPYIGRKPRYTELNATALITPAVPKAYKTRTLDIRNPKQKWFPDFGAGTGRFEFRLFDAPTDEYMAALQIKYVRALMNKAYNSSTIEIAPMFAPNSHELWRVMPQTFYQAAKEHFEYLGLNYEEFRILLPEAVEMRWERQETDQELEMRRGLGEEDVPFRKYYPRFENFLPAVQKPQAPAGPAIPIAPPEEKKPAKKPAKPVSARSPRRTT